MGRLIDETDLMNLLYDLDDARHELFYAIKKIPELPTVEAIPKADYENRIKADLVSILTEIQIEIEELSTPPAYQDEDYFLMGTNRCSELIQQKINALNAESEGV